MVDLVKVTPLAAKTVFIPGFGQVVMNPDSKKPAQKRPEVPASALEMLVESNVIKAPKDFVSRAERVAAEKAEFAQAFLDVGDDDEADEGPELPEGYALEELGGGWWEITGPEGFEKVKGQGKGKLAEAIAALPAADAAAPV